MEELLLSSQQPEEEATREISKRADAARSALRSYPAERSPEEQSLIEELQTYLAEQESLIRGSKEWKPEERPSRAQHCMMQIIISRRQQFIGIVRRVELLNDSQILAAEQGVFEQFSSLQNR